MISSRRAITGVLVMVVVVIVVLAAGVGSYVALNPTRSSSTSISSTIATETSSASSTLSTSSLIQSTASNSETTTSAVTPTTTSTSSEATSSLSTSTSEEMTMQNTTLSFLTTVIYDTSTNCSVSYNESAITNLFTSAFPAYLTKDLLGNFSQMSIFFNVSSKVNGSQFGTISNNSSELISGSYFTIGTRSINGSTFTLVGINLELSSSTTTENESGTIYFDPNWNATVIDLNGFNLTGSLASTFGGTLMIFFELPFLYTTLESAFLQGTQVLHEVNQTSATFGNVTMNVTNYNARISSTNSTSTLAIDCGVMTAAQVSSSGYALLQMGTVPGTNASILTAMVYHSAVVAQGLSTKE